MRRNLASKLPKSYTHFSHYLKTKNYSSTFYFNPVTPVEVIWNRLILYVVANLLDYIFLSYTFAEMYKAVNILAISRNHELQF
jgi:hypothetical protein